MKRNEISHHVFPSRLPPLSHKGRGETAGFSLVELLVGIAVAMLLMLLVTDVYSNAVWRQRDVAGGSDAQKTASISLFQITNMLKQAGSASGPAWNAWGCKLQAKKSSTTLLPLSAALPDPFKTLPTTLRLAPVLVYATAVAPSSRESDMVLLMASDFNAVGLPFKLLVKPASDTLSLANSNGLLVNDLLLTTQKNNEVCTITQVKSDYTLTYSGGKLDPTPHTVAVGGDYAYTNALATLAANDVVYGLGRAPHFNVYGVDPLDSSLKTYDLLQTHGVTAPTAIAENVFLLKALYGVDTDGDNNVNSWVSPQSSGWRFTELSANTEAARKQLAKIKAIRIALVTRGSYPGVNRYAATLSLFASVGGQTQTFNLTDAERRYRYQVHESVIPLFNVKTLDE